MEFRVTTSSFLLNRARDEVNQAYSRAGITLDLASVQALVVITWNDLRSVSGQNAVS